MYSKSNLFPMLMLAFALSAIGPACTPKNDTDSDNCEIDDSCDEQPDPSEDESEPSDVDPSDDVSDEPDPSGPTTGDTCSSNADCSYNGTCESGSCSCNSPWNGAACSSLTMGTVDKSVYGYRDGFPYTTSWGASTQFDSVSGKYIMLVSEYVEECANWGWNSTTVVATSTNPEGPYQREFTLFGVMSHEAMLARGPAGEWVAYFTATEQSNGRPRMGDEDYSDDEVCIRTEYNEECVCPSNPDKGSKDPTWMSYTTTPLDYGSWSTPVKIFDPGNHFTDNFADGTRAESIDANFNGIIHDDGTFVGLWRTWQCVGDLVEPWDETLSDANPDDCFSVPHAVRASHWDDSSTYDIEDQKRDLNWLFTEQYSPGRLALGIEDPMVYIDSRSPEVYHAIFHEMFVPTDNVAHAWSTDGMEWTYTGPVFNANNDRNMPVVTFTDDQQAGLACERPQLLVENGIPTHIIIGGIPTGLNEDPAYDAVDNLEMDEHAGSYGWPGGATMVIPLVSTP